MSAFPSTYEEVRAEIDRKSKAPFWERWKPPAFGVFRVNAMVDGVHDFHWGFLVTGRKPWYFWRSRHTPYMDELKPNAACYRQREYGYPDYNRPPITAHPACRAVLFGVESA